MDDRQVWESSSSSVVLHWSWFCEKIESGVNHSLMGGARARVYTICASWRCYPFTLSYFPIDVIENLITKTNEEKKRDFARRLNKHDSPVLDISHTHTFWKIEIENRFVCLSSSWRDRNGKSIKSCTHTYTRISNPKITFDQWKNRIFSSCLHSTVPAPYTRRE